MALGYNDIQVGDRVTIRTPQGGEVSGKTVMRGPAGWVFAISGSRHGQPAIATPTNLVKVTKGRSRRPDHLGQFLGGR